SSIAVAVSPAGGVVVAWGSQSTYDGVEVNSPWSVRAALLRSGAQRFAATQLLDPGHEVSSSVAGVSAAIAPSGTATVAWSELGLAGVRRDPYYGRCYPCPVRVATSDRRGRFGEPAQVARNGAALGIATARDGTTTVLWGLFPPPQPVDDYVESLDRVFASRRAPGAARFAPPVALSEPQAIVNGGSLALEPRSQRLAAVWSAAPGASPEEGLYDVERVDTLYSAQRGWIRRSRSG
ncbi:MAG: hypothetical protein QOI64_2436, partial [Solirubrobacteraceae bacterium]|nr:hypothetical protein [Solirubrobacteraceae bacterium]